MKVTCGLKFQKIGVFLLSDNMMLFVRIPHICHFHYTGRIFKFQIIHLKITRIYHFHPNYHTRVSLSEKLRKYPI